MTGETVQSIKKTKNLISEHSEDQNEKLAFETHFRLVKMYVNVRKKKKQFTVISTCIPKRPFR